MKKLFILGTVLGTPLALCAQGNQPVPQINYTQVVASIAVLAGFYLVSLFIIRLIRSKQDFVLRSKLIDKGVPEEVAAQFLQPQQSETIQQVFKWFLVSTGIAIALTIIYYTQPLGMHSAAIMAFCIAASFLAYYIFLKRSN